MSDDDDDGAPPEGTGGQAGKPPPLSWVPTSTAGARFYRLPTDDHPEGAVYGVDAASSLGGDQSGMRIVGFGTWVSAARDLK